MYKLQRLTKSLCDDRTRHGGSLGEERGIALKQEGAFQGCWDFLIWEVVIWVDSYHESTE